MTKKYYSFLLSLLLSITAFAQSGKTLAGRSVWTSDPFLQKAFIENVGQFSDIGDQPGDAIRYSVSNDGVDIYFTPTGVLYRHKELEKAEQGLFRKEEEERELVVRSQFLFMGWEGANPGVVLAASDAVYNYFTYPDLNDKSGRSTLIAKAYKKLVYRNIYPNIDIEFIVPENKKGIKYNVVLHPGADVSQLKMKYSGARSVKKDSEGNIRIQSTFGEFVDHAPQSFYESGKPLATSFTLNANTVSFQLPTTNNKQQTIIIDPWTTTPTFSGTNRAYDVEFDLKGNVYIYGGSSPWQLIKLDNAGVIQWTFTTTNLGSYYGDFSVDGKKSIAYMTEGFSVAGAKAVKVNAAGTLMATFPGNSQQQEMWRMSFSNCTGQAVIAGGGVNNANQAFVLDSNMVNMTPVNILGASGAGHDIALCTIDNDTNYYMVSARSQSDPNNFNNTLVKGPAKTLIPLTFNVPSGHNFVEINSVNYVNGFTGTANGFNGIAASKNFLYTYDGGLIKKWNKYTGAFISSFSVSSTFFSWGGTAADDCDNVYIGFMDSVKIYDSNFALLSATKVQNTVYDIRIGIGNLLYACGNGFVTEIPIIGTSCNKLTLSVTSSPKCAQVGYANVTVTSGGNGSYFYTWNPGGGTTQTVSGLGNGIYTVTVTENSCSPKLQTATVQIQLGSGNVPNAYVTSSSNISCFGASTGSATGSASGGKPAYTYNWSPGSQTSISATGLSAGLYTLTVTDSSGCQNTQTVNITQAPAILLNTNSNSTVCGNNNGSASASASGGTGTLSYSWSPGGSTSGSISNLSAGIYTITITDGNGCKKSAAVTIQSNGGSIVSLSGVSNVLCSGQANGSATASGSTGTSPYTYSWSTGATTAGATGLSAGIYTVTVTDATGCSSSKTVQISEPTALTLTGTGDTGCEGETLNLNAIANGGTGNITYTWNPGGQTGSAISVTPTSTTTYTVTATDANGCTKTFTVTATVLPKPTASFTANPTSGQPPLLVTFTNTSSGGVSYSWTFGDGGSANTQNATHTYVSNGTYIVKLVVTGSNGCKDSITVTIMAQVESSIIAPNVFSPNGDGYNDLFTFWTMGIRELCFEVYDRWGLKMSEVCDVNGGWDGKAASGKDAPEGTYYYILKATGFDDKQYDLTGFLLLLRK